MAAESTPSVRPLSKTKIVATVGPACDTVDSLLELIRAGVDVFRVNTAHGSRQEHQGRIDKIRAASKKAGHPVGILVDLAGPKIRLAEIPGGSLECHSGSTVSFIRGTITDSPEKLTSVFEPLLDELHVGDRILLADGIVELRVEKKERDEAVCRVVQSGVIRSRQGINLPGVKLSVPAMSDIDRDNARWAVENEVDFLGLSFVRAAKDIIDLKTLIGDKPTHVIAKIEKPEAVEQLDAIVEATDGIMVARGDLGVETDIAQMPMVQKRIIDACHRARKPVIVATQMLDSMQHSRIPTRAEVTDVANAILDGTDACMLSGETAVGEYPIDAVGMMHRIALATEEILRDRPRVQRILPKDFNPITEAVTYAAGKIADEVSAKMLVVGSTSGATALAISKYKDFVPTVGISDSEAVLRRMCLYWGIFPLADAPTGDTVKLIKHVVEWGNQIGYLASGDRIVFLFGTNIGTSRHNGIVVHQVP